MKSVLSFLLLATSLFSLSGCDSSPKPTSFDEVTQTGAYSLCLNERADQALVGSIHHGGSLWRISPLDRLFNWNHKQGESSNILHCDFSPDGTFAATADNRTIALWNTQTGEAFWLWNAPGDLQDLELNKEGNLALLAMEDYTATLFDIKNGGIQRIFKHQGIVYDVSLSDNSRLAASASDDLSAKVWDVASGDIKQDFKHDNQVRSAQISPDGTLLFTSALGEHGYLWEISSGRKLASYPINSGYFSAIRFSKDSSQILTGSSSGKIQLWDKTGKMKKHWQAQPRNTWVSNNVHIEDVAYSSSGYLASGANGRIFHLR